MVDELQDGRMALPVANLVEDGQGLVFGTRAKEVIDLLQRRSLALQRVMLPLQRLEVRLLRLGLELAFGPAAQASITARPVTVTLDDGPVSAIAVEVGLALTEKTRQDNEEGSGCKVCTFVLCSRHGSQAAACLFLLNSKCRCGSSGPRLCGWAGSRGRRVGAEASEGLPLIPPVEKG